MISPLSSTATQKPPKIRHLKQRFNSPVSLKETKIKPSLIKPIERRKQEKAKHYLAAEMDLNTDQNPLNLNKRKRKITPPVSFDDIDIFKPNFGYEHRTVNSLADETEQLEPSKIFEPVVIPTKRLKRRKPGYIDSEVDLMKPKEQRPAVALAIIRQNLTAIQENRSEIDAGNKNLKKKKRKTPTPVSKSEISKLSSGKMKKISPNMSKQTTGASGHSDPNDKYPILKNEELVQRFLKVDFTNNQKGRIRQVIKDILRGTSSTILPDVINNKIQAILKSSENLSDSDLRKIRVLYNMLKKATEDIKLKSEIAISEDVFKDSKDSKLDTDGEKLQNRDSKKSKAESPTRSKEVSKASKEAKPKIKEDNKQKSKEDASKKEKKPGGKEKMGMKRYVVFLGNLPIDVTREQIYDHFSDIREYIKDVRLPQLAEDKRSSIAYVEFDNAPVYEMALSRHHSMMGKKRINVLYTTPNKNSKISKTEAKAKSAKLMAMAKKGQLAGSTPMQRKRSHRRAKARAYQRATERAERELNCVSLS